MTITSAEEAKGMWAAVSGAFFFLLGIFTAGRKYQKFEGRVVSVENTQAEMSKAMTKLNDEIKTRLYRDDGTLIYQQASECKELRLGCPALKAIEKIEKGVDRLISMHLQRPD